MPCTGRNIRLRDSFEKSFYKNARLTLFSFIYIYFNLQPTNYKNTNIDHDTDTECLKSFVNNHKMVDNTKINTIANESAVDITCWYKLHIKLCKTSIN